MLRGAVTSLESGALRWREVWQSVAEAGRGIQTESAGVRRVAFRVCVTENAHGTCWPFLLLGSHS